MRYILMHKDIQVALLDVVTKYGDIVRVIECYNIEHAPYGTVIDKKISRSRLNDWLSDRVIPISRSRVKDILRTYHVRTTEALVFIGNGFSLSDHYWFKEYDSTLTWAEGNLLQNDFDEDVGDVLFNKMQNLSRRSLRSADVTTGGELQKRWKIIEGGRFLVKAGTGADQQEVFNELIASRMLDILSIPHVTYTPHKTGGYYCKCQCMITEHTEIVPAWCVRSTIKKSSEVSSYAHYIECCEKLHIVGVKELIDKMLVFDYLIANVDRHYNNFGLLRNPDTLEWIGVTPIYDNGKSFGRKNPRESLSGQYTECKPFRCRFDRQIKFVKSIPWLNDSVFDQLRSCITEVFAYDDVNKYINTEQQETIIREFDKRVRKLKHYISTLKPANELPVSVIMSLTKALMLNGITDTSEWINSHTAKEAEDFINKSRH